MRRSQRIDELCGQFEPRSDGQKVNLDNDVGERGEGGEKVPSGKNFVKLGPKMGDITHIFEKSGRGVVAESESEANSNFELAKF